MGDDKAPMDGLSLKVGYACPVGAPGEGPIMRNGEHPHEFLTTPAPGIVNLHQNFMHGVSTRPTAPCLGSRVREDGSVGPYEWQTYAQVASRVEAVAAGLWKLDCVPMAPDGRRFLGFFLKNCRDWVVGALSCFKTGVTVVPMYDTLGPETVQYIQEQTLTTSVICTASELPQLLKECPFNTVIVTGFIKPELLAKAKACKSFKTYLFSELEKLGAANLSLLRSVPPPEPADLAMLCYTSGTTGNPKGAMLSHSNILAAIANASYPKWAIFNMTAEGPQEVHISYLPLAHVFETVVMNYCLFAGCAVGFYQGDTLKLLDDLQTLRPTVFVSVPRLYTRFYDKIVGGAKAKGGIAAALFNKALAAKLEVLHATGSEHHAFWDAIVFKKVQKNLGLDRCTKMICGSAPITAKVKDFLRVALGVRFVEGYGLSETSAAASICHPEDVSNHHVGMPCMCCEIKLEDVPEMAYASSKPLPSGEVCVRGPCVFGGYYKMPDKTEEAIDSNGWFHTGDIGAWNANGCLRIIDRKKNIFKLSQGEYVAAEKIETVLTRCPLVAQVFVYGDSLQAYLVGVVVPDGEEVAAWAKKEGIGATKVKDILASADGPKLQKAVHAQMNKASKDAGLKGFEMIKKLHLEPELWSVENGMLTPTFKTKRNDLKKRYQAEIDAMYSEGAAPAKSKL